MATKKASPKKAATRSRPKHGSTDLAPPPAGPQFVCRGPRKEGQQAHLDRLLAQEKYPEARIFDRASRTRCGQPLDDLIGALPADGESHSFDCPRCGMAHHASRTPPDLPAEE